MLEESKTPGVADEGVKDLCKFDSTLRRVLVWDVPVTYSQE